MALPVLLVGLVRFDDASTNSATREFLAVGVDIDAAGSTRLHAQYVDVENEARLAGRLEPVHVVLGVRDRRAVTSTELSIDGGFDDHRLLIIFKPVVMSAVKFTIENHEGRRHIVMPVRHYGTILL